MSEADAVARTPGGMGRIAETFRPWPGAKRSRHPQVSFVARGPVAGRTVTRHGLGFPLGERSPLARLCDADATIEVEPNVWTNPAYPRTKKA